MAERLRGLRKRFVDEWGETYITNGLTDPPERKTRPEIAAIDGALNNLKNFRPDDWLRHYDHLADLFEPELNATNRADRRRMKRSK